MLLFAQEVWKREKKILVTLNETHEICILIPYNLRDSAIYGNLPIQYVT